MSADDDIDRLYGVDPADFTALRTELAAAAKKRGDAAAAKVIAAARRPTTAAWVVNVLVRSEGNARDRLNGLAEGLRTAHAAMDGARIRELSAAQRRLVDELVRTGFAAAGVSLPTAALRDDVVGTLQAAIADPDVAAGLGRLTKAERWSGFGEFGAVSTVGAAPKKPTKPRKLTKPEKPTKPEKAAEAAASDRVAAAKSDAEGAEQARVIAVETLSANGHTRDCAQALREASRGARRGRAGIERRRRGPCRRHAGRPGGVRSRRGSESRSRRG